MSMLAPQRSERQLGAHLREEQYKSAKGGDWWEGGRGREETEAWSGGCMGRVLRGSWERTSG